MSARDAILGRLRRAGPLARVPAPDVAAHYRVHARGDAQPARLARFCTALQAAHAEIHLTDARAWPTLLVRLMAARKLTSLLVGAGAPDAAQLVACESRQFDIVSYEASAPEFRQALFNDIPAGLSRARSGIAETGSLVLWTGPQEPRLLSLLPPVHFVLMDAHQVHADLHAAMTAEGWAAGLPTNVLLISGPSKTADIQQVLAYGAHGPRELIVLLCSDAGEAA